MTQSKALSSPKRIVILGGSYGGVSIAHYLLKHAIPQLPVDMSYQVMIVSASPQVMCRPACPRAMISDECFPQEKLFIEIPNLFAQYPKGSFNFINGTATKLDHVNRSIFVSVAADNTERIDFHALVIATGSSTPSLLGLNRDVDFLRSNWTKFREALPSAKSIIIAGGGPAGIETAGELGDFLNGQFGWFESKSRKPKVPITVVTADSKILPALRPTIASKAEEYLAKVGVSIIKNARVMNVIPDDAGTTKIDSKVTLTLSDGRTLTADLYIPATGTRPNSSVVDNSLLATDGRIETNASTLRVDKAGPRIYAIGDVGSYARPTIHGIFSAVPVLGANIKRDLLLAAGQDKKAADEDRIFKEDTREAQLVPIGRNKGVGAVMGYGLPSSLIWLLKGRDYWLWTTGNLWSGKQWNKES